VFSLLFGFLNRVLEPSNMRDKKAAGVSFNNTQRIERKPETGEDTRLKPLEKEGKQEK
jgi:hypothetical protein